jgi:hypothetical protein
VDAFARATQPSLREGARPVSGVASLVAMAALASASEQASLQLARNRCEIGDRVELTVTVDARPGEELRFADPPQLEPALALLERRLVPATEGDPRATMTLALVACERGVVPIGPFALELRGRDGSRAISTDVTKLDVGAPWPGETPPFGEWRLPPREAGSRWRWIAAALGALALLAAAGRMVVARRRTPAPPADAREPDRAAWMRLLERPLDGTVAARRQWCLDAHSLVRVELARRSPAAAFPWSREELVAARGLGAWNERDSPAWERLLADLERGIYARDSLNEPKERAGAPLLALLEGLPRLVTEAAP